MKLPPLNALKAFESSARNSSFLLASKELCVSPASVSRYIKILEAHIGFALFIRQSNGVKLTLNGQRYFEAIHPILTDLQNATFEAQRKEFKPSLTILSMHALAETWLVKHLWDYQSQNPEVDIKISLGNHEVDFSKDNPDVWLCYSNGQHRNCDSHMIFEDSLTLVCSPIIGKQIKNPQDVFNFTLLYDIDWVDNWQRWFHAVGVNPADKANKTSFERYSMLINAAVSGMGVAIGHNALIQNELETGALVRPFALTISAERKFYAVTPKRTTDSTRAFINWLIELAQKTRK